ncbi:hypothetical protein HZC31_08185 [Candidatus Woesearchaeota archaeon]|nr:hypothetical protein [Candidatus Woesearchaeota archaeon]
MGEIQKYTIEDLERISLGNLAEIGKQLQDARFNTLGTRGEFPHTLPLKIIANAHGLGTKKAYVAPDTNAGLEFLVARWQSLAAQFPQGVSIGFFDREGTTHEKEICVPQPDGSVVRADMGYPIAAADHLMIPGAVEALQTHQRQGLTVLMTGQSGVGRGYFSETEMATQLSDVLRNTARQGIIIDAVLYCPHHPKEGEGEYKVDCGARKGSGYGMLTEALAVFKTIGVPVDVTRSFVVGDKKDDTWTAELFNQAWAAKYGTIPLRSFLVDTGYAGGTNDELVRQIDATYVQRPVGINSIKDLPTALRQVGI